VAESQRLDRLVSAALTLSALAIAASVVYRTVRPQAFAAAPPNATAQLSDAAWRKIVDAGEFERGNPQAPITIAEFTDLECPACRGFQSVLDTVLANHAPDVRLLYIPNPLPYHRFAKSAANAAECSIALGAPLQRWIEVIYAKQDSLGLKSWGSYASEAGIQDTLRLATCARSSKMAQRIQAGLALGSEIKLNGTPTVVLDGWRFGETPTLDELERAIARRVRGEPLGEGSSSE
jgi:protein-disulfide isomerase